MLTPHSSSIRFQNREYASIKWLHQIRAPRENENQLDRQTSSNGADFSAMMGCTGLEN
jgi:hypothetical protein